MAVAIVTPAEGPSFGIAPAGTWTCKSCFARNSGGIPSSSALARRWLKAARADSCITLPSWPVRIMFWFPPGSKVASMKSTSPPVSVQATPVATPGRDVRNATSFLNRAGPR